MRVLHVISKLGLGGAERTVESLAVGLAQFDVTCGVIPIVAMDDAGIGKQMRRNLEDHGVTVFPGSRRRAAKAALVEAPRWLRPAIGTFDPDIVHLHTDIPELAWAVASLIWRDVARRPVVRTIQSTSQWGPWGLLGRFAEGRLERATVVAVSVAAQESFLRWRRAIGYADPLPRVIYNGVSCEANGAPPAARAPTRLCFAGRFERDKGIDVLLDALELLEDSGFEFELSIFGRGRLHQLVERRLRGLRRKVTLAGPRPDLRERLSEYDAVLMPSRVEGLPVLAIEAQCAQVPVLATDAPGLAESLPPTYPGRCPRGDPAAFAAMISEFVGDPERWRSRTSAARAWADERFSARRMVSAYAEVYRSLL